MISGCGDCGGGMIMGTEQGVVPEGGVMEGQPVQPEGTVPVEGTPVPEGETTPPAGGEQTPPEPDDASGNT